MRAGAGLVTALAAGALLLSACGPTVGGAGAIDTPTTTATTAASPTTSTPSDDATPRRPRRAGSEPDLHRDGGAVPDGGRTGIPHDRRQQG